MLAACSDSTPSLCIDWPDTTQNILDDEFLSEDEMMIDNSVAEPEEFGNSELPLHSSLYTHLESKDKDRLGELPLVSSSESSCKRTRKLTKPTVSKSGRRRKKPRGMPKRPLSAYNIFFRTQRTIVQAKAEKKKLEGFKGLGFEGLGKLIGKQWKALSKEERKEYEILAEKDRGRYRQDMDAYNHKKKELIEKERSRQVLASVIGVEAASKHCPNFVISESSKMGGSAFSQRRVDWIDDLIQSSNPRNFVENNKRGENELSETPALRPIVQPLVNNPGQLPFPPGMEIVLSDSTGRDRKYRVDYKCYRMSRAEASRYIDSFSGSFRPYEAAHAVVSPENWGMPQSGIEVPNAEMAPLFKHSRK
eukprot:CAMPEP_0113633674 /NCGR_PEP_ID=MMETSP0017_2-20120614/17528_1 /TAXON_ID=2856 /ORGANISM="Cylindrotheca closterium" /LENGTH=362 /DNA_ID=CAMNT_0000544329 /DNA_START=32 /DNA_END=1120 /DNA_ORIENTATION=- /assembly_acc=CAM_ASM_000147